MWQNSQKYRLQPFHAYFQVIINFGRYLQTRKKCRKRTALHTQHNCKKSALWKKQKYRRCIPRHFRWILCNVCVSDTQIRSYVWLYRTFYRKRTQFKSREGQYKSTFAATYWRYYFYRWQFRHSSYTKHRHTIYSYSYRRPKSRQYSVCYFQQQGNRSRNGWFTL